MIREYRTSKWGSISLEETDRINGKTEERERERFVNRLLCVTVLPPFQFLSLAFKYSRSILTVPNIIEVRKRRGEKEESKKLSHCLSSTPIILTVLRTFDRCNRYAQAYRVILLSRTPLRFLKGNNRKLSLIVEEFLFFLTSINRIILYIPSSTDAMKYGSNGVSQRR